MSDTTLTYRGRQLRSRPDTGQRGQPLQRRIYQAVDADPTRGYWYSTAHEAAVRSNASDRILSPDLQRGAR